MIQKICIISDADSPQVNGVVRHVHDTIKFLEFSGKKILLISPHYFQKKLRISKKDRVDWVFSCEFKKLENKISEFSPDAIHIMTEGSLGLMAQKYCKKHHYNFTTSYHTMWPEYFNVRYRIPLKFSEFFLKKFHKNSQKILTPSPFIKQYLERKKYNNQVMVLPNAVDLEVFTQNSETYQNYFKLLNPQNKPILLFVGRLCKEKNLQKFLNLPDEFLKIVVGDGPLKTDLEKYYLKEIDNNNIIFLGEKFGQELSHIYRDVDVFVFPSLTDTFGIVILEALACGTQIAGYPTMGTQFIAENLHIEYKKNSEKTGIIINNDLEKAVKTALKTNFNFSVISQKLQEKFSLNSIGQKFLENLVKRQKNDMLGV